MYYTVYNPTFYTTLYNFKYFKLNILIYFYMNLFQVRKKNIF